MKASDWPALEPTTPHGSMPILEVPGHSPLSQFEAVRDHAGVQAWYRKTS